MSRSWPRASHRLLLSLVLVGASGCSTGRLRPAQRAVPDTAHAPPPGRFYKGRHYGSEQQFNPLTQIVNEGFDLLRGTDADRRVLQLPYGVTARYVANSLRHADQVVRQYGWARFVKHELLPLSTKGSGGGGWVPNYQFHLLGSGMVSVRMTEWFEAHGVPHPAWASFGVMTASHVLNEMTERASPRSIDAVADLLIFDPLGHLLARNQRLQRLFSEQLELTSWAQQPVFTIPGQTLENAGQQYLIRAPIPRTQRWRAAYLFGVSTLLGLSRSVGAQHAVTVGLGADAVRIVVLDSTVDLRTVELRPNAGLFLDRNGSLLASLLVRLDYETVAALNLYPGLRVAGRTLPAGLYVGALRRGGVRIGLVAPLGLGAAYATPTAVRY